MSEVNEKIEEAKEEVGGFIRKNIKWIIIGAVALVALGAFINFV
jgi:hypothetical protein